MQSDGREEERRARRLPGLFFLACAMLSGRLPGVSCKQGVLRVYVDPASDSPSPPAHLVPPSQLSPWAVVLYGVTTLGD